MERLLRLSFPQKFERRRQHDLISVQVRTPTDFKSHNLRDVTRQHMDGKMRVYSELPAQVVMSSSVRQLFFTCSA